MSTAGRPGTTYFVPGVRIMKLGAFRRGAPPARAAELPADVQADLMSVKVTRVNTGACEYSLTLNNWHTTTAADRASPLHTGTREAVVRDRPPWPRFKYNDFALLAFGDRLRIDLRYWPDPAPGFDAAATTAQQWMPMIAGPIVDMSFVFSTGQGAQVVVTGMDDLNGLQDKVRDRIELGRHSERRLVLEALARADFPLRSLAPPRVPTPPFFADESRGIRESINDGQSCFQFLQGLASRLDFEFFLEFERLEDPDSPLELHFEPCRARTPPRATLRDIYVLDRETNLVDFTPTIQVLDQYSSVVFKGRHHDPRRPESVEGEALASVLADELHRDPELDRAELTAGPAVRERFFPGRPNPYTAANQTNLDRERAQWLAEAALRQKARKLFTVKGTTVGLPRLRPGNHVEIRGFRPPFDGFYYVVRTEHTYGADGLRTVFTANRPGMPLPPYQES